VVTRGKRAWDGRAMSELCGNVGCSGRLFADGMGMWIRVDETVPAHGRWLSIGNT
jgi:hypothetical protein